ncbi:MAG TPA: DUF4352 domain-containing protein [Anaerolineaceae bacterium]|nr:DUF4352 domain-containing protein [Anaerolineaceae bacterium]HQJ33075.1 DUF4352 domain-containing protein [Anaerolineaceae bacterium]
MKKNILLIVTIILTLGTAACGGSTQATPEKVDPVAATVAALDRETAAQTQVEEPTLEPTIQIEQPTIEPTLAPLGYSRANPYSGTEIVSVPNWDVQVLEIKRGIDAWNDINAANPYNEPAPEGMEYLLVKIYVKCTYNDSDEHGISGYDFDVTGDKAILYTADMASVVKPTPELDAKLVAGGETEGWSAYLVGQGESNLMLIFDEMWSIGESSKRYIALDAGASINVPSDLYTIPPSELGKERKSPVPFNEKLVTEDWETSILEVVRGDAAWNLVLEANQFNEPPTEGYEYIAVKFYVRYIGTEDNSNRIDGYFYNLTGSANILHDLPSVVDPNPALDISLYPGGEFEGWVVFQSVIGETNLMFAFEETWNFDDNKVRYLALDEGASLEVPSDLKNINPTDTGKERNAPALMSETVITENWEISVVEVIRGAEAWNMALAANQFNSPPEDGFEYVAVKVYVHNIDTEDVARNINNSDFNTIGSNGVLYDVPSIVDPEPALDITLFPDGEYEGWMILTVAVGETELRLVYNPLFEFSDKNKRFISLEP